MGVDVVGTVVVFMMAVFLWGLSYQGSNPAPTSMPAHTRSPVIAAIPLYLCRRLPFPLLPLPPRLLPQPRPSPQPSLLLLKDARRR